MPSGMRALLRSPLLWTLLPLSVLHLATLFPGVGGRINRGDSAKFQFIGEVLGLSHPPGNPLYMLLDAAVVRLPLPLSTATKISLLSTLFGVLTLAYLFRSLARLSGTRSAVVGTVALGLGPLFWTFSTEAEVYTLNTFLLAGSLFHAIGFGLERARRDLFWGAGFFLLGFANHLTSVAFVPAFLLLAILVRREGAKLGLREVLVIALLTALSASLYAYIALRAASQPVYSEMPLPLEAQGFWEYITARKFQGHFASLTWDTAVTERMPTLFAYLEKQWLWPLLMCVPLGLVRLAEKSRALLSFVVVGLLGLFVFAFAYDIPDPDGFYMPVCVLLALCIGLASEIVPTGATRLARWSQIASACFLASLLALPAIVHVRAYAKLCGFEEIEEMGDGRGPILWDLEDLVARVPEGATLAVPCAHYGCVQVLNYYRFADPTVKEKRITFARLPGMNTGYWDVHEAMQSLGFEAASERVLCTIREEDARGIRARGVAVDTIEREGRETRSGWMPGVPIYCSRR